MDFWNTFAKHYSPFQKSPLLARSHSDRPCKTRQLLTTRVPKDLEFALPAQSSKIPPLRLREAHAALLSNWAVVESDSSLPAAAVVGGTPLTGGRASVIGTVIGALIMIVLTTSFNMNDLKYSWSLVIKAAIILLAVYLQRPKTN